MSSENRVNSVIAAILFCISGANSSVATENKSFARDFSWRSIGLAASGWTSSVSVHPENPDIVWAAADMGGGLYYTLNGGKSWVDVSANIIRDAKYWGFSRIVSIHPLNDKIIFAGGRGVLIKTEDFGKTWQEVNIRFHGDPVVMDYHPANPDIIYFTDAMGGIFKSNDRGNSFELAYRHQTKDDKRKYSAFDDGRFARIKLVPFKNHCGYVLFKSNPFWGVFKSVDEGRTWQSCNDNLPHEKVKSLDYHYDVNTEKTTVYALLDGQVSDAASDGWVGGVYASADYGKTWQAKTRGMLTSVPKQFIDKHLPVFNSLAVSNRGNVVLYVLGSNICNRHFALLSSKDGGESWQVTDAKPLNTGIKGEGIKVRRTPFPNMINLSPSNPDIFYVNFSPILRFERYGEAVRQIEYEILPDGKYRWLGISHVCNKGVVPDPFMKDYVHTKNYDTGYNRISLKDGTVEFFHSKQIPMVQGANIIADPGNKGVLYLGSSNSSTWVHNAGRTGGVCKSTDHGKTFTSTLDRKESGLPSGFIYDIKLDLKSPVANRVLYTSVCGHGIYRSDDSGNTWTNANGNLPQVGKKSAEMNIQRIHVDAKGGIYAVFYGGRPLDWGAGINDLKYNKIYFSNNKGGVWTEFADMKVFGGNVFDLSTEPENPATVYIASYAGVFKSENQGRSWEKILENTEENIKKGASPYLIAIHPERKERIWVVFCAPRGYADKWGVWVSENKGQNWQQANNGLAISNLTAISIDYDDPDIIYVGTNGSGVFRGTFNAKADVIEPAPRQGADSLKKKELSNGLEVPRQVFAEFSKEEIRMDGKFSESVWARSKLETDFTYHLHPWGIARKQTYFAVCHDRENLYVRVKCDEPNSGRFSRYRDFPPEKHDTPAWNEEGIELYLETNDGETECVTVLIANAKGAKYDLRYYGEIPIHEWQADPPWEVKIFPDRDYFEMLFKIPFRILSMDAPGQGRKLKFKICRNRNMSSWTPVGYFSPLEDFGEIVFNLPGKLRR